MPDVRRVYTLFLDEKRSVQYLTENSKLFIQEEHYSSTEDKTVDAMETAA